MLLFMLLELAFAAPLLSESLPTEDVDLVEPSLLYLAPQPQVELALDFAAYMIRQERIDDTDEDQSDTTTTVSQLSSTTTPFAQQPTLFCAPLARRALPTDAATACQTDDNVTILLGSTDTADLYRRQHGRLSSQPLLSLSSLHDSRRLFGNAPTVQLAASTSLQGTVLVELAQRLEVLRVILVHDESTTTAIIRPMTAMLRQGIVVDDVINLSPLDDDRIYPTINRAVEDEDTAVIVLLADADNSQRAFTALADSLSVPRTLLLTNTDGWYAAMRQPEIPIQVLSLTTRFNEDNSLGSAFLELLRNISGVGGQVDRLGTRQELLEPNVLSPSLVAFLAEVGDRVDQTALLQFEQNQANKTGIIGYVGDEVLLSLDLMTLAQTALNANAIRANVSEQLLTTADLLRTTVANGVTGPVAFDSTGEREGMEFIVVFRGKEDTNVRTLGPAKLSDTGDVELSSLEVTQDIPEACREVVGICPACDRSLIIPIVVGVMAFLVFTLLILYCGRQRVGASLFEQTAKAERFAQVARQEAEVKASFLANMSHEIRTPLHAILSMGRMLMESRLNDPTTPHQDLEDLTQIIRSSETLEALVNDILFVSKMQTSSFSLINKQFDGCELLEDITELLALRWASKNVECITRLGVPEFELQLEADSLRLRQVLTNLSTNAMKFTNTGTVELSVTLVRLHPEDDYASPTEHQVPHLLFRVADTGAGMSKETMLNLFQRFFQGSHSVTNAIGGAGLGLAIAAELVSLMGGTIGVWSAGPGQGSEFWFTLPVKYHDPKKALNQRLAPEEDYFESELQPNVARVAYEPSTDFIQERVEQDMDHAVRQSLEDSLEDTIVIVMSSRPGLLKVLQSYLTRWNIMHVTTDNVADAASKVEALQERLAFQSRLVPSNVAAIVDTDDIKLDATDLQRDIWYIFVCNDSLRRVLQSGTVHWVAAAQNHTILSKPVKRLQLYKALITRSADVSPGLSAIQRTQDDFSFRRHNRPLDGDQSRRRVFQFPEDGAKQTRPMSAAYSKPATVFEEDVFKSASLNDIHASASAAPEAPFKVPMQPHAQLGASVTSSESESQARILLAEDNTINVKIAQRFLQWTGLPKAVHASNGREALQIFKAKGPFDLILMDCQMPVVDGYEATRRIRAYEREHLSGREVPIVAMTAFSLPEDQEKCLEVGMNDYISKPFTKERFRDKVLHWLRAAAAATPAESQRTSIAVSAQSSPRLGLRGSQSPTGDSDPVRGKLESSNPCKLSRCDSAESNESSCTVVDTTALLLRPPEPDVPSFTLPPVQVDMLSMLSTFAAPVATVATPLPEPAEDKLDTSAWETAV
eukprot:m.280221 g.280221  ORF g.280221 m.280221 type:complete len:1327 (-) comp17732_c0_seq2:508-4488(-)